MFQYIEEPDTVQESSMVSKRKEAVMLLWNITERWGSINSHGPCNLCPLRYNTLHFSNWSMEVTAAVNTYQATVIREAQLGYDGQDIPGTGIF